MSFGFPNHYGHVPVGTGQQVPTQPYPPVYGQPQPVVVVHHVPPPIGPNAATVYRNGYNARQIPPQALNAMRGRAHQQYPQPPVVYQDPSNPRGGWVQTGRR